MQYKHTDTVSMLLMCCCLYGVYVYISGSVQVRMWNLKTGNCVREVVGRSGAAILTSRLTGMRLFSCR
jgi:hypothetical protein